MPLPVYGVLLVEYRGYGGNPGGLREQGFYRDGRAAMAFLAAQGFTPAQTVIVGNSIGSGTAMQMAREYEPAALILSSPFTSLTDAVAEKAPLIPVRLLLRDQFDNADKVQALKAPMLVLHGTADAVVPFAHGKRMAKVGAPATFIPFEGEGHDLTFTPEAQAAQVAWLAEQGL
ncbi:MAG: prolyl oligopeptidase family serine peptidase [Rhizobiales bacterium]|nr:prolyl oligopeptidase family serine peptidase [Hyphomicrobiales bacterium]